MLPLCSDCKAQQIKPVLVGTANQVEKAAANRDKWQEARAAKGLEDLRSPEENGNEQATSTTQLSEYVGKMVSLSADELKLFPMACCAGTACMLDRKVTATSQIVHGSRCAGCNGLWHDLCSGKDGLGVHGSANAARAMERKRRLLLLLLPQHVLVLLLPSQLRVAGAQDHSRSSQLQAAQLRSARGRRSRRLHTSPLASERSC